MARRPARAAALAVALLAASAPPSAGAAPELAVLEQEQDLSGPGKRGLDVAPSPDGRHVYAVSDRYVLAFRRNSDGTLDPFAEVDLFQGGLSATDTRIVVPDDGLGVLALTAQPAALISFTRNPEDGALERVEHEQADLSSSALEVAVSRDGTLVYVASPGQDAVVVYRRTAATGALAFAQKVAQSQDGVSGLVDPHRLAVSPDDRHVYVAAFRTEGDAQFETIALLRREPDDTLAFVEFVQIGPLVGSPGLADLLVAPGGDEVLALDGGGLGLGEPVLLRLARDPDDGRLAAPIEEPFSEPGFYLGPLDWIVAWPDGRRLFAGGLAMTVPARPTGTVVAWTRADDGAIAPLIAVDLSEGVGPVGAASPSRGAISPDGRFVYANRAQQGVFVLVPEPHGGAAAAAAALLALATRKGKRGRWLPIAFSPRRGDRRRA